MELATDQLMCFHKDAIAIQMLSPDPWMHFGCFQCD